jgi:hypothetical protein
LPRGGNSATVLGLVNAPSYLPPDNYPRLKVVRNFPELLSTPLDDGVNALCWPRVLPGDFGEIVRLVEGKPGIAPIDEDTLQSLPLSPEGCVAREILLADQALLRSADLSPELDCVTGSVREFPGVYPTDVYSFHADSATVPADTILCTYIGACSEGLRNDEALRRIDVPEIRAALLATYGGTDDEGFQEYLSENFHDLHYVPLPDAQPFSFGLHNLWRIAIAHPDAPVPPCIHRAPPTTPAMPSRLLLLS